MLTSHTKATYTAFVWYPWCPQYYRCKNIKTNPEHVYVYWIQVMLKLLINCHHFINTRCIVCCLESFKTFACILYSSLWPSFLNWCKTFKYIRISHLQVIWFVEWVKIWTQAVIQPCFIMENSSSLIILFVHIICYYIKKSILFHQLSETTAFNTIGFNKTGTQYCKFQLLV